MKRSTEEAAAAARVACDVMERMWTAMWKAITAMVIAIAIILGIGAGLKIGVMTGLFPAKKPAPVQSVAPESNDVPIDFSMVKSVASNKKEIRK